jgi:hypothetical protein
MAKINVSGRADLLSALSSANGGDTIILENGNYGSLDIENRHFGDYVTIRAENSLGAKFHDIDIRGSSHVRIDGVHVSHGSNGGPSSKVVTIDGDSRHVEFINSEVNGLEDGKNTGHYGIHSGDAQDVTIKNNYVHDVKNGIVVLGTKGVDVVGNEIDKIGSDAMKFASMSDALIENNTGPRTITQDDSSWHMDFMQFQGNVQDTIIRGNVFMPESTSWSQGIFAGKGMGMKDVLIEQNIIYTGILNGIKIYDGSGIVVQNNTVLNTPDGGHKATDIIVPSGSVEKDNIVSGTSGGNSGSNLVAQHLKPGKAFHYDDLFDNAGAGPGASLEDLRPIKGGPADGKGAAQRLAELLDGATSSPRDNDSDPVSSPAPAKPKPAPEPDQDTRPGAEVTLDAEGGLNGKKGEADWGEGVTIEAIGLNGKSAALAATSEGIGVAGGRTRQLDYDAKSGESEKLVIDFGTDVDEAEIEFAMLNSNERGVGETGLWVARNAAGKVVDQGEFGGGTGDVSGKWQLDLDIDPKADFRTLEFEATPLGHGANNVAGDNSEFLISSVTFTPEYTIA